MQAETQACTQASVHEHTHTLSRVHCPVNKYTETTGVWWCSRLPRSLAQYYSLWWRWRKRKLRCRICWQWPVLAIHLSPCHWSQLSRHRHAARAFRSTPGAVEVSGDRERCYMNAIALKTAICKTFLNRKILNNECKIWFECRSMFSCFPLIVFIYMYFYILLSVCLCRQDFFFIRWWSDTLCSASVIITHRIVIIIVLFDVWSHLSRHRCR